MSDWKDIIATTVAKLLVWFVHGFGFVLGVVVAIKILQALM